MGIQQSRWSRIIPVVFIMYTLAYIDRSNLAIAIPSIGRDLEFSSTQAGIVAGIFFLGYGITQIPGGYLAERWSARLVIALCMGLWGLCAAAMGFAQSAQQLGVLRLALGLAEGGVLPATVVLLSAWFSPPERARANGLWLLCQPVAMITVLPLSGWLIDRIGWRWMFVIEGILPVIWVAVWLKFIDDSPAKARWLPKEQRHEVSHSRTDFSPQKISWRNLSRCLQGSWIWLVTLAVICLNAGAYGFMIWLPSAMKSVHPSSYFVSGLLSAVPFIAAGAAMWWNSLDSDRRGERIWHTGIPMIVAAVSLMTGVAVHERVPVAGMFLLMAAAAGIFAGIPTLWAMISEVLPPGSAGIAAGFINGVGNLGGFLGPFAFGRLYEATKSFEVGFMFLSGLLLLAGVIIVRIVIPQNIEDELSTNSRSTLNR